MILKKLSLLNYRNIESADLVFSDKINCFIGMNGEGKTNILDSIFFLSFTKSTASSQDSANIRHGEDMMMVQGTYDLNGSEEVVSIGLKMHQKKSVKRNQKAYKKLSEHIGMFPLVIVSPRDSELIVGGSEERRRFMDLVISQYDAEYIGLLSSYNRALQQRNSLLKAEEEPADDVISVYEDMMAMYGEMIFEKRRSFIEELVPLFQKFYGTISGEGEEVGLVYTSHCQRGPLLDMIRRDRMKDRVMGYSLHGVHKDELEMTLGGFPIKREGSQGQSKTYLVALKLAQYYFLSRAGKKTAPLLLLDDIFDKLDSSRVENIVRLVSGESFGQIFITDTNRENMDLLLERCDGDYRLFSVSQGRIVTL